MSNWLECKQCGGQIPLEDGSLVSVCPFCGSQNTVGKSAGEQNGLVNRANYLRRNNEFDKASAVYEELLKMDNTDYEAHWGLVLCRFGIEYVEDPATQEQVPTCHRTAEDPVYTDISYRAALEYAPLVVREVYEKEAAQIDTIQKNIIALSRQEEKFDVFLCYKELDEVGNRTEDSVIAQELEFELSRRGYRVFFARKTLENVLGSAYEPIIYAALQSAKAMVVLGTQPDHFTAVWVQNEWQRFRELIKKGAQKILIPAYRGMSPYDLPMELSNLQALDMGKLGFVQDLCDGIDRFTGAGKREQTPQTVVAANTPNPESLLKRACLFIEEGNLQKADGYLERVLDLCPEEPRAYMGKLLIELGVRTESRLAFHLTPLDPLPNYQKALRFSSGELHARYEGYNAAIQKRIQEAEEKKRAETAAAEELKRVAEAVARAKQAAEKAERDEKLRREVERMEEEKRIRNEKAKKFNRVFWPVVLTLAAMILFFGVYLPKVPYLRGYQNAEKLYESGDYAGAAEIFSGLGDFRDAAARGKDAAYKNAEALLSAGEYEKAAAAFRALGSYNDAAKRSKDTLYQYAEVLLKSGDAIAALEAFENLGSYNGAYNRANEVRLLLYENAQASITAGEFSKAIHLLYYLGSFQESEKALLDLALQRYEAGDYGNALLAWNAGGKDGGAKTRAIEQFASLREDLYSRVSAGKQCLLAIGADGTVRVLASSKTSPPAKETLTEITAWNEIRRIAVGENLILGLKQNGTAVAVGLRSGRVAPDVSKWRKVKSILVLDDACFGVTASGRIVFAGDMEQAGIDPDKIRTWGDVYAIDGGGDFIIGLKVNGRVLALGNDQYGQCDVDSWRSVATIVAKRGPNVGLTVGIDQDGAVVITGSSDLGQTKSLGWSGIQRVATDGRTVLGLRQNGTVFAAGDRSQGKGDTENWENIIDLAISDGLSIGLREDGTAVTASSSFSGAADLAGWSDLIAVWAVDDCVLGLGADGTLHMAGDGYSAVEGADWKLW
ncbi:MAG: TIR domain-containing protein [Eubacteriales bacterium]|nr:TIR domain-containing protein [Eubacteriales bacterium]